MTRESPFHEGEQRVQERLGVRDVIEPWARQVVRSYLPEEHRNFHTSLPFLVAAARDADGRPWATLLTGPPGFVDSPDPRRLILHTQLVPGDALENAFVAGAELGLLGIELETRRRNRVNGRIATGGGEAIVFEVDQAFGNCPQYIHERSWQHVPAPKQPAPAQRTSRLSPAMQELIRSADTFFIASGHRGDGKSPIYGMDASHRGGDPGFVEVQSDTQLVFPDYAGNNHYNTIGNLIMDDRAGFLFVDFARGSLLQLTGRIQIDWDSEQLSRTPGARRLLSFEIEEAVELPEVLPLHWSEATEFVRTLRLVDKIAESEDVTSFVFESRDGGPLPGFEAGQHLPIQIELAGHPQVHRRTYSLSNGPGEGRYRISVKREPKGLVSQILHDFIETGAFVDARRPAGEFVLTKADSPIALISAGIGLTPMLSMLHELVGGSATRPVWFIHGARDGAHHPLGEEVRDLVGRRGNTRAHIAYSRPRETDKAGLDYDSRGRVDCALVADLVPDLNAEFYLCGPTKFMAAIQSGLIERGVKPDRIHAETFGPVGCTNCV